MVHSCLCSHFDSLAHPIRIAVSMQRCTVSICILYYIFILMIPDVIYYYRSYTAHATYVQMQITLNYVAVIVVVVVFFISYTMFFFLCLLICCPFCIIQTIIFSFCFQFFFHSFSCFLLLFIYRFTLHNANIV